MNPSIEARSDFYSRTNRGMSLRMKTGICKLLLLHLLLLAMVECSLAKRGFSMADSAAQELVKAQSFPRQNTASFPATAVDNHHVIPRTQFNSNSPPDADDEGTGSGEING
ncbi:uncharacterized protein LOC110024677 [Phalaenopsis equestris]|uniref:uncharacterized protein LOC110024677 n=1 Tax=Phalaenopsis equestris TaxID=78828 RepID=UPI0009E38C9C|nr:uncharacterized protein LOC110024677 [Phalaenopsis equestris]